MAGEQQQRQREQRERSLARDGEETSENRGAAAAMEVERAIYLACRRRSSTSSEVDETFRGAVSSRGRRHGGHQNGGRHRLEYGDGGAGGGVGGLRSWHRIIASWPWQPRVQQLR